MYKYELRKKRIIAICLFKHFSVLEPLLKSGGRKLYAVPKNGLTDFRAYERIGWVVNWI